MKMRSMKKMTAAILLFDLTVGLLFLGLWEERERYAAAAGENVVADTERIDNGMTAGQMEEIRKIALTFDDGPHPYYTEELLDGLKERGVVVTFFVTGEHAALHPEVIKRMQEDA